VLFEPRHGGAEPHVGARVLGCGAQHRFEHVLRDEAGELRAHLGCIQAGRLPERQLLGLGECAPDGHPVVVGEVSGGVVHRGGEPELAEDLHAAEVEAPGLGLRRCGRAPLHERDGQAVVA
jgi:hypothetical protein